MRSEPDVMNSLERSRLGVILARGDGKRLFPLTRTISGDDRPQPFCAVITNKTLWQRTQRRVSLSIHPGSNPALAKMAL
ncbi:MAG: hypothetical protein M3Y27_31745 [Acidobacteriota bacterium]|nr:hypothetical protein [Acidobacteriota bacterium]